MNDHRFAIVTRDDIYSLDDRALMECRLTHGSAVQVGRQISARDDLDDALLAACDEEAAAIGVLLDSLPEGRARVVVSARTTGEAPVVTGTIGLTVAGLSMVSTRDQLLRDYELLVGLASVSGQMEADYRRLRVPMVWRNGSAAVLLHEAIGHAAEHGQASISWPPWLHVADEPEERTDDLGRMPRHADLVVGEPPTAWRRESFSDIPLRRMSRLVARQRNAPFTMPPRRIEILLLAGGGYDPLTQTVELFVAAADLDDGEQSARLRPFVIRESRGAIARAIAGASGQPQRYPGVVCSSEGQELYVASYAPLLVTEF